MSHPHQARLRDVPITDTLAATTMLAVISALRDLHRSGHLISGHPLHDQSNIMSILDGEPTPATSPEAFDPAAVEAGYLHLPVFDQTALWVDRHGTPHHVADLDDTYRANIIGHLQSHAAKWWTQVAINELHGHTPASIQELFDRGGRLIGEMSPAEWIEQTPLMLALRTTS